MNMSVKIAGVEFKIRLWKRPARLVPVWNTANLLT